MKTIAQQLNVKEFPFIIKDKNWNEIYREESDGFWIRSGHDSKGRFTFLENSEGTQVKQEFDKDDNVIYLEENGKVSIDDRPIHVTELKDGEIAEIVGGRHKGKIVQRYRYNLVNLGKEADDGWGSLFTDRTISRLLEFHPDWKVVLRQLKDVLKD